MLSILTRRKVLAGYERTKKRKVRFAEVKVRKESPAVKVSTHYVIVNDQYWVIIIAIVP